MVSTKFLEKVLCDVYCEWVQINFLGIVQEYLYDTSLTLDNILYDRLLNYFMIIFVRVNKPWSYIRRTEGLLLALYIHLNFVEKEINFRIFSFLKIVTFFNFLQKTKWPYAVDVEATLTDSDAYNP